MGLSATQTAKRKAAKEVAFYNGIMCVFCGEAIHIRWDNNYYHWNNNQLNEDEEFESVIKHFEDKHPEEAAMFVLAGNNVDIVKQRAKEALSEKVVSQRRKDIDKGTAVKVSSGRVWHYTYENDNSTGACGYSVGTTSVGKWDYTTRSYLSKTRTVKEGDWLTIDSKIKCKLCKKYLGE